MSKYIFYESIADSIRYKYEKASSNMIYNDISYLIDHITKTYKSITKEDINNMIDTIDVRNESFVYTEEENTFNVRKIE